MSWWAILNDGRTKKVNVNGKKEEKTRFGKVKKMLSIEALKSLLEIKGLTGIEFEDYYGNTLFFLSDLDYADVERTLRLQVTREKLRNEL